MVFVVGTIWVGHAAKLGGEQNFSGYSPYPYFIYPLAAVVIFQPPDAARAAVLPVGQTRFQRVCRVYGRVESLGVCDLTLAGIGLDCYDKHLLRDRATGRLDERSEDSDHLVSIGLVVAVMLAATRGLGLGKWVHNAGGLLLMVTFAALIGLPFFALYQGTISEYHPFAMQIPTLSAYNINVCSKLALGALTGFEYVAILAGETKAPARNIARSVVIAAPIIAVMFILGTSSVLAFVTPATVDLISPIPQVLSDRVWIVRLGRKNYFVDHHRRRACGKLH